MITKEMIPRIEQAFGFTLYEWQKDYLLGNPYESPYRQRARGKTFAYCLWLLLSDGKPITRRELLMRMEESHRFRWFFDYICDINKTLVSAGFETRIENETLLR